MGIIELKILLSVQEVKGEIVLKFAGEIADFHLKCSTLMENPKNAITGSNVRANGPNFAPADGQAGHRSMDRSLKTR